MNNKKTIIICVVAGLILVLAIALFACNGTNNNTDGNKEDGGLIQTILGDKDSSDDDSKDNTSSNDSSKDDNGSDKNNNTSDKNNNNTKDENTNNNGNDSDSDNDSDVSDEVMTYERYISLSAEDQQAYFKTYSNPADFFAWYNTEKQKYDDAHKSETGDGSIDIGDYIGKQ